jgi:hypothetical protein
MSRLPQPLISASELARWNDSHEALLSPPKVAAMLRQIHPEALDNFKDLAAIPS